MNHTPEPWEAVDRLTIRGPFERGNPDKPGWHIATMRDGAAEGDARRIAACINACQGTPTDALEEMAAEGQSVATLALYAERQRRTSIAAANALRDLLQIVRHNHVPNSGPAQDAAASVLEDMDKLRQQAEAES